MLKYYTIMTIVLILLSGMAMAENLIIIKNAPSTAGYGEPVRVTISLTNNLDQRVDVNIRETVTAADAVEPELVYPPVHPGIRAAIPPYFEWNLSLEPRETKSVSYTIRPTRAGDHLIGPSRVTMTDRKVYRSNPVSIRITCNANAACEQAFGENYRNCPEDCKPWDADGRCNAVMDGHCDEDCVKGADPDCAPGASAAPGQERPPRPPVNWTEAFYGLLIVLAAIALPLAGILLVIGIGHVIVRRGKPADKKTEEAEIDLEKRDDKNEKKRLKKKKLE